MVLCNEDCSIRTTSRHVALLRIVLTLFTGMLVHARRAFACHALSALTGLCFPTARCGRGAVC